MTKILSNKSNIDLDYPICRPSLDLDFTQEVLDPRITFSRGSIGTRVNRNRLIETVSANLPRFDYDPVTGECKGLLIEESRSNLLLQSTTPDNLVSPWGKGINTTRVGVTTAPDGTNTAVYYSGNGSSGNEFVNQVVNLLANTTYTVSVWAKLISGSVPTSGNIITASYNNGIGEARSNVSFNGNLTTEWKRFSTTYTNINAISYSQFFTADQNNTAQIAIWGAQVEAGAFPTSYIPTVASTVTRSADNASMTGTNFSSWYNSTEGTLYASINNITTRSSISYDAFVSLTGTDVNRNVMRIYTQTASGGGAQNQFIPGVSYSPDGSYVVDVPLSVVSGGGPQRIGRAIIAYQRNNFGFTVNGAKPTFGGKGELPTCNLLTIFGAGRYQPAPSGYIKRLTYYPRRLKDNQLVLLTQ
jgi:hypothetical protein